MQLSIEVPTSLLWWATPFGDHFLQRIPRKAARLFTLGILLLSSLLQAHTGWSSSIDLCGQTPSLWKHIPPPEKALQLTLLIQHVLFYSHMVFLYSSFSLLFCYFAFGLNTFNFPAALALAVSCSSCGSQHQDTCDSSSRPRFSPPLSPEFTCTLTDQDVLHPMCSWEYILWSRVQFTQYLQIFSTCFGKCCCTW